MTSDGSQNTMTWYDADTVRDEPATVVRRLDLSLAQTTATTSNRGVCQKWPPTLRRIQLTVGRCRMLMDLVALLLVVQRRLKSDRCRGARLRNVALLVVELEH